MHNLDFMLQTLVNLALHYPQAGRTPAQLRILAEDWAEDLAAFPRDIVERAGKGTSPRIPVFPYGCGYMAALRGIAPGA